MVNLTDWILQIHWYLIIAGSLQGKGFFVPKTTFLFLLINMQSNIYVVLSFLIKIASNSNSATKYN